MPVYDVWKSTDDAANDADRTAFVTVECTDRRHWKCKDWKCECDCHEQEKE